MDFSSVYNYRLDWIASFVAVAQKGGFSAAAKALYRSQPRVSSHIGELEHVLGARLFDRSVQPVALTPEGRALLPHAEEVLFRIDAFSDVAEGADGVVRGEVRIGMYPSAAAFLYPPLVRQLRRQAPTVGATLREGATLSLESLLNSGEIDLAIRPVLPLVKDDRLVSTWLWSEPLVAVVPTGHPLAGSSSVTLQQIAPFPVITVGEPTEESPRHFETDLALAESGVRPVVAFQTNQPQTLASMVRGGLGVGITNALAMLTANCDGVRLIRVASGHVSRHVALWWRGDRAGSAAVDLVREVIGALPTPRMQSIDDPDSTRPDPPCSRERASAADPAARTPEEHSGVTGTSHPRP
ncbi:HTH-type transcriptional regulator CysB [Streptomyces sp. YIM 130001]|uniref:LysR family transcriptional regulator n=1 Tax=Streptomyces sp. YIM 130001 TaxID=2259644 RepID=UPI000EE2056A|nr:LysR family transcriptional regulator [Streptomyces sp. YIM 130001]RII17770.1 HTH-type transcriptional regulator CysB [Streptomyces sp. YIM 130001]